MSWINLDGPIPYARMENQMPALVHDKPANFISAAEARTAMKRYSVEDVFNSITSHAEMGAANVCIRWNTLPAGIVELLTQAGYSVKRGGSDNDVAVISW